MAKSNEPCVHHWMLAAQDDHDVAGECKFCGAKKTFNGFVRYTEYIRSAPRVNRG